MSKLVGINSRFLWFWRIKKLNSTFITLYVGYPYPSAGGAKRHIMTRPNVHVLILSIHSGFNDKFKTL